MSLLARKKGKYTYGDYSAWPDDERWELIDGIPYDMTPAPSRRHQDVSEDLHRQAASFLFERQTGCRVYAGPFDVRLAMADEPDEEVQSVVQPDLILVCDPDKLDDKGCRGAPDWIVEILSPSTAARDRIEKVALYEKHMVKEYWIIDPVHNIVTVRLLGDDGLYGKPREYEGKGALTVFVLPDLRIDLDNLFRFED